MDIESQARKAAEVLGEKVVEGAINKLCEMRDVVHKLYKWQSSANLEKLSRAEKHTSEAVKPQVQAFNRRSFQFLALKFPRVNHVGQIQNGVRGQEQAGKGFLPIPHFIILVQQLTCPQVAQKP